MLLELRNQGIYLDLRFRHAQSIRKFGSFRTRQIFCLFECFLKSEDLLAAKRWTRVFFLGIRLQATIHVIRVVYFINSENNNHNFILVIN